MDDGIDPAGARESSAPRGAAWPRYVLPAVLALVTVAVLLSGNAAGLAPASVLGWAVLVGVVAALVGWSALLSRLVRDPVLRSVAVLVPVVAVLAWGVAPTLVDRRVDEDLLQGVPMAGTDKGADADGEVDAGSGTEDPPQPAAEPALLASGALQGLGRYDATGTAAVYRSGTSAFVRLEDIEVSGAPDVVVHLVPAPDAQRPDEGITLEPLKGNVGSSNYVLPEGTDVSAYRTVLLWCRAFGVPIGSATLSPT